MLNPTIQVTVSLKRLLTCNAPFNVLQRCLITCWIIPTVCVHSGCSTSPTVHILLPVQPSIKINFTTLHQYKRLKDANVDNETFHITIPTNMHLTRLQNAFPSQDTAEFKKRDIIVGETVWNMLRLTLHTNHQQAIYINPIFIPPPQSQGKHVGSMLKGPKVIEPRSTF